MMLRIRSEAVKAFTSAWLIIGCSLNLSVQAAELPNFADLVEKNAPTIVEIAKGQDGELAIGKEIHNSGKCNVQNMNYTYPFKLSKFIATSSFYFIISPIKIFV